MAGLDYAGKPESGQTANYKKGEGNMLKATAKPSHYAQMWGKAPGSHQRQAVPRWVTCNANKFIRMLDAGELTPCSDAEWERICRLLHMEPENAPIR